MALKNIQILAIVGIAIAIVAVIAVAVVFTSDNGDTGSSGSLSGRYKAVESDMYVEFSGENKIKMEAAGGITAQGTYALNGNQVDYEWTVSYSGQYTKDETGYGTISDDKQEIIFSGIRFVKI